METLLLSPTEENLALAARALREGQLVGMPTETVYGLGADALNEEAVRAIFAAKGRPADNPLIVHVPSIEAAEPLCHIDERSRRVMAHFCPGPLTLLLPRMGFGVEGVFLAEPISNAIGGLACFITMWLTVYRKLDAPAKK